MSRIGIGNSFGRLRRVVLGSVVGAKIPPFDRVIASTLAPDKWKFLRENGGKPFPRRYANAACAELDAFARQLEGLGVEVDRPTPIDFSQPIRTPDWTVPCGLYAAMPRDILLVTGKTIIVAPMCWRSRFREREAYARLLQEYEREGMRVQVAPRPRLTNALYRTTKLNQKTFTSILTESEPVFDAADFVVHGKYVLGQLSHVTNQSGVEWLRNALGPAHDVRLLTFNDPHAMHIDATFLPLNKDTALINPNLVKAKHLRNELPDELAAMTLIAAPRPNYPPSAPPRYLSSDWISMNIFALDAHTLFIEEKQSALRKQLVEHGFDVLPVAFRNFQCFGGSLHCATQEIARD